MFDYTSLSSVKYQGSICATTLTDYIPLIRDDSLPRIIASDLDLRSLYLWATTWARYESIKAHQYYSALKSTLPPTKFCMLDVRFSNTLELSKVRAFFARLDGKFCGPDQWGFDFQSRMLKPSMIRSGCGLFPYFDSNLDDDENAALQEFINLCDISIVRDGDCSFPLAPSALSLPIPLGGSTTLEEEDLTKNKVDTVISVVGADVATALPLTDSKTEPGVYLERESVRSYVKDSFPARFKDVVAILRNVKSDFIVSPGDGIGVAERACKLLGKKGFFSDASDQMVAYGASLGHALICETADDTLARIFPEKSVVFLSHVLYSDPHLVRKVLDRGYPLVVYEHDTLYPGLSLLQTIGNSTYLRVSDVRFWKGVPIKLSAEKRVPVRYPKWTEFLYAGIHLCFSSLSALRYLHSLVRWGSDFSATYIGDEFQEGTIESLQVIGVPVIPPAVDMVYLSAGEFYFGSWKGGHISRVVDLKSGIVYGELTAIRDPVHYVFESEKPFFVDKTDGVLKSSAPLVRVVMNEVALDRYFVTDESEFLFSSNRSLAMKVIARVVPSRKVKSQSRRRRKSALDKLPPRTEFAALSSKPSEASRNSALLSSRPVAGAFRDPRGRLRPVDRAKKNLQ